MGRGGRKGKVDEKSRVRNVVKQLANSGPDFVHKTKVSNNSDKLTVRTKEYVYRFVTKILTNE